MIITGGTMAESQNLSKHTTKSAGFSALDFHQSLVICAVMVLGKLWTAVKFIYADTWKKNIRRNSSTKEWTVMMIKMMM